MKSLAAQLRAFTFPTWPRFDAVDLRALLERQAQRRNLMNPLPYVDDIEDLLRIIGALVALPTTAPSSWTCAHGLPSGITCAACGRHVSKAFA